MYKTVSRSSSSRSVSLSSPAAPWSCPAPLPAVSTSSPTLPPPPPPCLTSPAEVFVRLFQKRSFLTLFFQPWQPWQPKSNYYINLDKKQASWNQFVCLSTDFFFSIFSFCYDFAIHNLTADSINVRRRIFNLSYKTLTEMLVGEFSTLAALASCSHWSDLSIALSFSTWEKQKVEWDLHLSHS